MIVSSAYIWQVVSLQQDGRSWVGNRRPAGQNWPLGNYFWPPRLFWELCFYLYYYYYFICYTILDWQSHIRYCSYNVQTENAFPHAFNIQHNHAEWIGRGSSAAAVCTVVTEAPLNWIEIDWVAVLLLAAAVSFYLWSECVESNFGGAIHASSSWCCLKLFPFKQPTMSQQSCCASKGALHWRVQVG